MTHRSAPSGMAAAQFPRLSTQTCQACRKDTPDAA